jgi:ABC-type nitrate/sulfonate/bicarbonate transport system substrate-binding protein
MFGVIVVVVLIVAAAGGYFAGTASGSKTVTNTTTVSGGAGSTVTTTVAGGAGSTVTTTVTGSATVPSSSATFTIGVSHFTTPPTAPTAYIGQNNATIMKQYVPNAKIEVFAGGSTAILTAMASNTVQVGVAITDSALTSISKGVQVTIVGTWETSPNILAVWASANSQYSNLTSLKGATFAVTGATSASGIATRLFAGQQGWTSSQYSISPVGSTSAILAAVSQSSTTVGVLDPFVQVTPGQYKIVGLINETWPNFSIVAANSFITAHPDAIKATIAMLTSVNQEFNANLNNFTYNFMHTYPSYNMTYTQFQYFKSLSYWSPDATIPVGEYATAISTLQSVGVITTTLATSQAITNQFATTYG